MPGRNDIKKTASTLNSRWLQNTLKSMGVAGTEVIKDLMPATSETISTGSKLITDAAKSIRNTKSGSTLISNAIKSSPAIKMGQEFFSNALEDLKSGNLYNTERTGSDEDFNFGDMDDWLTDDEVNDVNIENNIIQDNGTGAATLKAIQTQSEYQIRSSKATVDTMVSIASASMIKSSEYSEKVLSELATINSNLAAMIEYNNTNMTKFIEASIGYYEQATSAMSSDDSSSTTIKPENIFSNGGLDLRSYKDYVKQNITKAKDNSMVGGMLSLIVENKDAFVTNPLGMVMKSVMQNSIPSILKTSMESLDKAVQDFFPVVLERIGEMGDSATGPFAGATKFISDVFGIKTKRKDDFDTSKIVKGPIPYNGVANHTIVEIIPKYLRESNTYLKEIAQAITGKDEKTLSKGFTGFDWETGKFSKIDNIRAKAYDQILSEVSMVFERSEFGKKLSENASLLKSEDDRKKYDDALAQFYNAIERHEGQIDFRNKDHLTETLGSITATDSIKNLIEASIERMLETNDAVLGDLKHTKQKATRSANSMKTSFEEGLSENGLYQVINGMSVDDYAKQKVAISGGIKTETANQSVPNILLGIQRTLDRGIYVQVKKDLGISGSSSDTEATGTKLSRKERRRLKQQAKISSMSVQSKEDFKNQLEESESLLSDEPSADSIHISERAAHKINSFTRVLNGIMAGDADKAWDEFISGMSGIFKKAGDFMSENFLTPMKVTIFGEKDNESGYTKGGIFEGVNNRMKESFFGLRRMITGKGYTDSQGNTIADATEDEMKDTVAGKLKNLVGGIKDSIKVRLFGSDEKDEDGNEKKGLFGKLGDSVSKATSSLMKGLHGWNEALFGKKEGEEINPEEDGKKLFSSIKDKFVNALPDGLFGSLIGAGSGIAIGGLLGNLITPGAGALIGFAGGILSKSEKFQNMLFGKVDDETGERTGGIISKKMQDYVKKNGKFLAGGAAIGALKGILMPGSGLLVNLVGGPVAGAIMGIGTSMLLKSDMFNKFLFGDVEKGKLGLITNVKNWVKRMGADSSGDADGGKLAGMMAIGAGAGGLLGMLAGGPLVGSMLGLSASILAQKDNFKEWLFGKEDENGNRKEGLLGKFKNMISVNVLTPMKNTFMDIGEDFKTFLQYDVLERFNLAIEPIGNAISAGIGKITSSAMQMVTGFKDYIKDNFLDGLIDTTKKVLSPLTSAIGVAVKGVYNVSKTILGAPFKLLSAITSPIAQAVGKVVSTTAKVAFKGIDLLLVKPINNLVLKPLGFVVKGLGKIVSAPFKLLGKAANFLNEKVAGFGRHVGDFFKQVGIDLKESIKKKFAESAVGKWFSKKKEDVKEFIGHVKDTISLMVRPVTDLAKSVVAQVGESIKKTVSTFMGKAFGFILHPFKSIGKLGRRVVGFFQGKDKDTIDREEAERDQARRDKKTAKRKDRLENGGFFAKAWEKSRKGVTYGDDNGAIISEDENGNQTIVDTELSYAERVKRHKQERANAYRANRDAKTERKNLSYNEKMIAKYLGNQRKDYTAENKAMAEAEAARRGATISWKDADIKETPAEKLQREGNDLQEESLNVQDDTRNTLKNLADFLMGRDKRNSDTTAANVEQHELGARTGEQKAKRDENIAEAKKNAKGVHAKQDVEVMEAARKRADKKESDQRVGSFRDNIRDYGFKKGIKMNWEYITGQKYGYNKTRKELNAPDEPTVSVDEPSFGRTVVDSATDKVVKMSKRDIKKSRKEAAKHEERRRSYDSLFNSPEFDDFVAKFKDPNYVDKFEKGTTGAKPGPAIVGEKGPEVVYGKNSKFGKFVGLGGPEVVNMKGGETVIPNHRIAKYEDGTDDSEKFDRSSMSNDNILKTSDDKKLSIGERLIKGLLSIKDAIKSQTFSMTGGTDDGDTEDKQHDTTNLDKLKNGAGKFGRNLLRMIPGYGLVKGISRGVRNTVELGKTVIGAGKEVATIAKDKAKDAFAKVSSLTSETMRAKKAAQREEDSDDAREDAKLQALEGLLKGQKEHSGVWNSIFSKKGLITGAILAAIPLIMKFLPKVWDVIKNLGIALGDGVKDLVKDFIWTEDNAARTDGNTIVEQIGAEIQDVKDGNILTDTNGEATRTTDSMLSFLGRRFMNFKYADKVPFGTSKLAKAEKGFYRGVKAVGRGLKNIGTRIGNSTLGQTLKGKSALDIAKSKSVLDDGITFLDKKGRGIISADDWADMVAKNGDDWAAKNADNWVIKSDTGIYTKIGNKLKNTKAGKATGAAIDAVKNSKVGKVVGNAVDTVKGAKNAVVSSVDNVVGAAKGKAANAGKVIRETVKKAANAGDDKAVSKIAKYVDDFFEFISKKMGKKGGENALKAAKNGLMKAIKTKWDDFAAKVFPKIAAKSGAGAAGAALSFGISEAIFATIGAVNGVSGTAKLFNVSADKIDGTMKTIAGIIGALAGTTVGGIIDIILTVAGDIAGVDFLNSIAVAMYSFLVKDKSKVKALESAQADWKQAYIDERDQTLVKQYETQKKAGLIGDITYEEFVQGIEDGTYSASYKSFNDWNTSKNKSLGDKIASGTVGGLKKAGKGIANAWGAVFGSKDKYYTDDKGNQYRKNDDGTYQVTSANGEDLGFIHKDALPDNLTETKAKKDGALKKAGKAIASGAKKLGAGIASGAKKAGSAIASGAKKLSESAKNLGKKAKEKATVAVGKAKEKLGNLKDKVFSFGKKAKEKISNTGNKVKEKATAAVGKAKEKLGNLKDKVFSFGKKAKEKISNSALGKAVNSKIENVKNFFKSHSEKVWYTTDGSYYKLDGDRYYLYNSTGNKIDDTGIDIESFAQLCESGELTEGTVTVDSGLKTKLGQIGSKLTSVWTDVSAKAEEKIGNIKSKITEIVTDPKAALSKVVSSTKNFFMSHTETRWHSTEGGYYQSNGSTFNYYNDAGDLITEGITVDEFDAIAKSGVITKSEGEQVTVDSGIKTKLANIGSSIKSAFSKTAEKATALISNVKEKAGSVMAAINEAGGVKQYIGGLFKKKSSKVWYDTDGNYYKLSADGKYTKHNVNGDILEEGVDASKIEDLANSGLITEGDLVEDSAAQKAIKDIQSSVKEAWGKAKDTVKNGWDKFKSWIGGGSGISTYANDMISKPVTGGGRGNFMGGRGDYEPSMLNGSPYYSQNDSRWASNKFVRSDGKDDGATMGNSGCGPTAMSMVIADMTGKKATPTELAKYAQFSGTRDETGTNWNFIDSAARTYGLNPIRNTSPSADYILNSLRSGNPMILSGQDVGSGDSPYTKAGHYVVAVGVDANGNIIYNDPRGKSYSGKMNVNDILDETGAAWTFNRGGFGTKRSSNKIMSKIKKLTRGGRGSDIGRWLKVIQSVKQAIASKKPGYSQTNWINITIGKKTLKVRTDCSGYVAACMKYFGVIDDDVNITSRLLCDKNYAPLKKSGFTYMEFPGWDSLQPGDIVAKPGHTEIYAGKIDNGYKVYNCGNDSTTNNPSYTPRSSSEYTVIWRPGAAGSNAISDTELNSSSGTLSDLLSSIGSAFTTIGSTLFNSLLSGNTKINWKDILNGNSDSSSDLMGSSSASAASTVSGNDTRSKVWNYLANKGLPAYGIAGLMGNLEAESGFVPKNLENKYETSLGFTDATYTTAVNTGSYPKDSFINDKAGYGLAQWTYSTRKKGLYELAKQTGRNIDDVDLQMDWLWKELSDGYPTVLNKLKTATSVTEASNAVLHDFERPADQSAAVERKRANYGQNNYDRFAGGRGEGATIKTKRFVGIQDEMNGGFGLDTEPLRADITNNAYRNIEVRRSISSNNENMALEGLMSQVVKLLGVICDNSNNLIVLNDIKKNLSNYKPSQPNIISNTTNNVVSQPQKSKSTQMSSDTTPTMSRNELMARRIAFGQ